MAYLKKAQCIRKLGACKTGGIIIYDDESFFFNEEPGKSEKKEDVIKLLEKAMELSTDMPEAIMQLGLLNRHSFFGIVINEEAEAKELLSKAIHLKPDYAAAFNNRAMLSYNSEIEDQEDKDKTENIKLDNKNAIADITEAIRIRPSDAIYHLLFPSIQDHASS